MIRLVLLLLLILFNGPLIAQKFLPPAGKQLLILGQDLNAVDKYVRADIYPAVGGHTVYLNLFNLTNASGPHPYGGLGEDTAGNKVADVNWGAGPVNAHKAAFDPIYKNSVLVIGLSMNDERLNDVEKGNSDSEINRLGKFIRKVGKPVYLRIAYEFEGAWNAAYADPKSYIGAFRRVTKILRQQGVTNFATVWQTSASPVDDVIERRHENIEDWYPGDDVVDWMAISWFLNPDYTSTNSDIKTTQRALAEELLYLARQHNKPVMIAESTPQGYDLKNLTKRNIAPLLDGPAGQGIQKLTPQEIWKSWYEPFFHFIKENKNLVRAVAYINANWDAQPMWGPPYHSGYWGNSQVQENEYITREWRKEISRKNWLHGSEKLFSLLTTGR